MTISVNPSLAARAGAEKALAKRYSDAISIIRDKLGKCTTSIRAGPAFIDGKSG